MIARYFILVWFKRDLVYRAGTLKSDMMM